MCEEASKYPATADSAAAFRHGANEVIGPDFRGILFLTPGTPMGLTASLARSIERFGGKSIVFAPDGFDTPKTALTVRFPDVSPALAPVFDVTPAQLLGYKLAQWRGADCDTFHICTYVVGEEE